MHATSDAPTPPDDVRWNGPASTDLRRRAARAVALALALAASLVAVGCVDDPQPIPIPGPRRELFRLSGALPNERTTVDVVGLPGSVPASCDVTATNSADGETERKPTTPAGSFVLRILARIGDQLAIGLTCAEGIERFTVVRDPASMGTSEGPAEAIPSVPPVVVQGDGTVLVRGRSLHHDRVVAAAPRSGDTGLGVADPQTRHFAFTLAARSGDAILVFIDLPQAISEPWQLTVP